VKTDVGQKFIQDRLNLRAKKSMQNALTSYSKLNELCQSFAQLPGIKKAVIVETKNNGGIPRPGCIIYSSINFPIEWRTTWSNQPLDEEYSNLVARLLMKGYLDFYTTELRPGQLLQGLFKAQGIEFCHCVSLHQYPDKFFFLAIDFYDRSLVYNNEFVHNTMRTKITEVKTLMKNA
jgi:hypothetical protein